LLGSALSTVVPTHQSFASHTEVELEINNTVFDANDDVTISGTVDAGDENDDVEITVETPSGSDENDTVDLDEDGTFDYEYSFPNNPDDGVYRVSVVFDNEDPVFGFFVLDDEDDEVEVLTNDETYRPDDEVMIDGTVEDEILEAAVDEVEITVIGPDGDEVLDSEDVPVESNGDFEYDDLQIEDSDDAHGLYAIIVSYDNEERGWLVFEVVEDGGGSGSGEITATVSPTSADPGDTVTISGSIDEDDVEVGESVFLTVEDPDGAEIVNNEDVDPDADDGTFEFEFDLENDAETGTYEATLSYMDFDDKVLTFTVTTSSSGGGSSGGGSSGSDSGLTARLSKSTLQAGETLSVTGVVPRIVTDEDGVSVTVFTPERGFIAAKFPEPESSKAYSTSFSLPTSLEEEEDYIVVVFYDDNEVELSFDVEGKVSGGTGGPLTVRTDKTSYAVGSTVRITGEVGDEIFVSGQQIALQVFNPENAPYRFDPIEPESDGSYSYSMVVGGPLGVTGEWDVKVTYSGRVSETTFDLTGGVPAKPKFDLKVDDDTYPIEYQSDSSINSMYVRPAEKKLVVAIEGDQDGTLTLVLPRDVIDAVQSGSDIKYIVTTLDTDTGLESEIDITESLTTGEARTIVIDYEAGTDLIEIQGTSIVPEFGMLSGVILAVAVFGVIAATIKFSNRFSAFRNW
jgi:uncharacterized protein YfaS (alpha-2-macroglobulin family)